MSNDVNTQIKERVVDVIKDEWVLFERKDLLDDCLDFVIEEALTTPTAINDMFIYKSMIKFLSNQSSDTISSKDIDEMAKGSVC
jgi:hypothetical protein|tara:strand:+ start:397 stop:648 length:252 start_codon:yes stop_codon:yes gene_type:complete